MLNYQGVWIKPIIGFILGDYDLYGKDEFTGFYGILIKNISFEKHLITRFFIVFDVRGMI